MVGKKTSWVEVGGFPHVAMDISDVLDKHFNDIHKVISSEEYEFIYDFQLKRHPLYKCRERPLPNTSP